MFLYILIGAYRRNYALTQVISGRLDAMLFDVNECSRCRPHVPRPSLASCCTKQASASGGAFGYSAKASLAFGESSSVGKTSVNTSATSKGTDKTSLEARYWQYIRVSMPRMVGAAKFGKLFLSWLIVDRRLSVSLRKYPIVSAPHMSVPASGFRQYFMHQAYLRGHAVIPPCV